MVRSGSSESRTLECLTQTALTVFVIVRCSESRTLECLTSFIQEISSSESRTLEFFTTSRRDLSVIGLTSPVHDGCKAEESGVWGIPVGWACSLSPSAFTIFLSRFMCLLSKKTFGVGSSLVKQKRDECCRKWFGSLVRPASVSTKDNDVTTPRKRVI